MNQNTIEVAGPDPREKRRRLREVYIALAAVGLMGLLTWIELHFFGVESYLFLAFFNVNLILLLLVLFLVVRNVFKLVIERRRKVLGSKLRTRLVMTFIALSIVPTVLMFFIAVRFVHTSVDYWFQEQVGQSMQQALEVGQVFYASVKQGLEVRSEIALDQIRSQQYLWGGPGMSNFLENKKEIEHDLSLMGIISPSLSEQNWFADEEWETYWPEIRQSVPWDELLESPEYWTGMWPSEESGDLVVGIMPVDEARTGFLVMGQTLEPGLLSRLDGIVQGIEEYRKLETIKNPMKTALYTILGVITLLIIFGSTWFGFKLSREISAPVQALAEGTERIARGDLSVRLQDQSDDELGLLVQSFNKMARDLEKSQNSLTRANMRLASQNQELESRGRYMHAVLDNITAGVISVDHEGRITTVNKAAEYILGIDSRKVLGQYPLDLVGGEYGSLIHEVLNQLHDLPESQWQRQLDLEVKGRIVKILVNAVILRGEQGDDYGIVAVFEDITELEKMQRLAAWREVARRIAHEIKNPLTPIKLSAQRLEKKFSSSVRDPSFEQSTQLIIRQVENLQQMVREFSTFAKLPEVRPRTDSLDSLVQEVVSMFEQSHRQIGWELTIASNIPQFSFDRDAMKRVLLNIFLNAAEAIDKTGDGKVSIDLDYDAQLNRVFVQVADNGPGLSSEERARLFEPYYSSKKEGTGLGLAIAKSIVSDHGGYVRVKSNQPRGTVFVVELPVRNPESVSIA
ncbi:multi-sensor signal transduction histidine kinase [Desulfonatronospira thiodismutans ASO3-1]|uniref:histidine kinase n=1 Tax=Desulfonatronospira thiodismutans ASO3-1 TaxID=555779 RepID=D6SLU1_9BACT|nr:MULTISPECIES: ATP-binding protein [Desulfonatronospira]EFI35652.1 multi-sensor signal transduction histidine kinase [Desulfonatronospira thiodismutans ASO3-1]RQD74245.1 MAG: PAS domain-containing sensor histidine kinase [Desulfonatronospira sp. MSAO_Bac3]